LPHPSSAAARLATALLCALLLLAAGAARAEEPPEPPQSEPQKTTKETDAGRTLKLLPSKLLLAPLNLFQAGVRATLNLVEEERLVDKVDYYLRYLEDRGVYPSVFDLGDGSGVGAGLEVRRCALPRLCLGAAAGVTHKLYQGYQASASVPLDGLEFTTRAGYLYRPEEEFFGLGPETTQATQTNYLLEDGYAEGLIRLGRERERGAFVRGLQAAASVRLDAYKAGPGKDSGEPSIEEFFSRSEVPGLDSSIDLLSVGLSLVHDDRDWPDLPTTGGRRRLVAALFHDTSGGRFDFWRARLELEQLLPFSSLKHAFILRALGEINEPLSGNDEVPFFLQARLGGSVWLRGFHELRFYDEKALTWSVEYRYRIWGRADAFLYVDQGEVFGRGGGFSLGRIATSGGGGFMVRRFGRAHSEDVISGGPEYMALRERLFFMLLLGGSGEGFQPFITFGAFL
jgi:hypothetical protein